MKYHIDQRAVARLCLLVLCVGWLQAQKINFSVHGYLSQAYGKTDGLPFLGIPEEGTTDYRNMAIQLRLDHDEEHIFIVQLTHKRVGVSPLASSYEDVELDWGFYKYQINANASVKVGKVLFPSGIYNELRDVGPVLPYFRAPILVYGDGQFFSETLNGAVFSQSLWERSDWRVDYDLFYGGWESLQSLDPTDVDVNQYRDAHGVRIWLNTPVEGLRVGYFFSRDTFVGEGEVDGVAEADERQTNWIGSVDGTFERWVCQLELRRWGFSLGSYKAGYAYLGLNFGPHWQVNLQASRARLELAPPLYGIESEDMEDDALGLNYRFARGVVKLEYHRHKNSPFVESRTVFVEDPQVKFYILSLAVGF